MGISIDRVSRQRFLFYSMVAMLIGLFASRALLSAGMVVFLALACFHNNFLHQLRIFTRTKFLVALALLFLIPFFSGLWSADKNEWLDIIRIKLPLLFFPVAFAGNWGFSKTQWIRLAFAFLLLVFAGTLWSFWQYLQHTEALHAAYLKAKTLPTPLENDHVRFSWMVCMAVVTSSFLLERTRGGILRILLLLLSVFFIAYLHLLSARTGLVCLYIFGGLLVLRSLFLKKSKGVAMVVLLLVLVLPLAAWFCFPTFQNRIRYIDYDFSYIKKDVYLQGGNDGNRVLSLKAGWNTLQQYPFGVGAGDVIHHTKHWYAVQIPGMLERDKIYPSSEWLIYGSAAGWPGFVLFSLVMLVPLLERKTAERFYWISVNGLAALSFLFDIGLEVQFGVFLYVFVVLAWWKWSGKLTGSSMEVIP